MLSRTGIWIVWTLLETVHGGCGAVSIVNPDGRHQIDGQSDTQQRSSEMLDTNTVDFLDTSQCATIEPCQSLYDTNILRQINGCLGIYISGSVEGVEVDWTTDTGASRSIISKRTFDKIPSNKRPKLKRSNSLTSVNGEPLKEFGKAIFEIQLDNETFQEEIIVAEIEDQALLGLDILLKPENGPVKINLDENTIHFRGNEIQFRQTIDKVRRVLAADSYVIPANSEKMIDVFIDRFDSDRDFTCNVFCIEPMKDFNNRFPLLMASCLIDMENKISTKVRVLNPFKTEANIHQDDVIG